LLTPVQLLKLHLLDKGMMVSPEAARRLAGEEGRPLSVADYASTSGIAMRLEGDVWVNAPINDYNPNFVERPPHLLDVDDQGFMLRSSELEVRAWPVPVARYHDHRNSLGELHSHYAYSHTDRVRAAPIQGCSFRCTFCNLSYEYDYSLKRIEGLVEAIRAALDDELLPARHVLLSGGTPTPADHGYLNEIYEAVFAAFKGVPIDVMMTPKARLLDVARLDQLGICELSVNMELWGLERAKEFMPGKAAIGREAYLDFLEHAATTLGPGRVRSLLLVGLEPAEHTLAGVRALCERGCTPVLSPFRPDPSTPMGTLRPPKATELAEVYLRSVEVADSLGAKLGPRCIPCQHNTVTFPDGSDFYFHH
jgi:hypothetical protein